MHFQKVNKNSHIYNAKFDLTPKSSKNTSQPKGSLFYSFFKGMKRDPFFEKVWTRYMNFKCSQPAHKHMQFSFGLKAGYEAWVKATQEDTFPSEQAFMANLNAWITSDGWHTNSGQFIPQFSEFIKKQRYLKPFTFSAKQSVEVIPDATQEVNQKLVKHIDAAIHQRECKAIAQATKALTSPPL